MNNKFSSIVTVPYDYSYVGFNAITNCVVIFMSVSSLRSVVAIQLANYLTDEW